MWCLPEREIRRNPEYSHPGHTPPTQAREASHQENIYNAWSRQKERHEGHNQSTPAETLHDALRRLQRPSTNLLHRLRTDAVVCGPTRLGLLCWEHRKSYSNAWE